MRSSIKFSITLPRHIRKWLEARSNSQCRSLSAEIVYILKTKMSEDIDKGWPPTAKKEYVKT